MVGTAAMREGLVIGDVAPAIRLAGKEGDAFAGLRGFDEGGKIRRQCGEGELVHDAMAFVVPGAGGLWCRAWTRCAAKSSSAHGAVTKS